jgi:hypothetical protein
MERLMLFPLDEYILKLIIFKFLKEIPSLIKENSVTLF